MHTRLEPSSYRKAPQLAQLLREHIREGAFAAGQLLPPETELAKRYGVARMTLRKALGTLAEEGHLVKLPHRGILVPEEGGGVESDRSQRTERRVSMATVWAAAPDYGITKRLEGIRRYCEPRGVEFGNCLFATNEEALDALERIADYGVDGIMVYPYKDPRYVAVLARLIDRGFPIVSFRGLSGLPLSTVGSDDSVAVYRAVHFLIDRHRRPVYYIGEVQDADSSPERHAGYRGAMEDAGFGDLVESHTWRMDTSSVDPRYWPMDNKWLPGFHVAERLLAEAACPMSIFAVNDYTALGVYKAAERCGLTIGRDVCVVGADDLPLAEMLDPRLTTLHASTEQIGFEAARLLHRIIERKASPPISVRLAAEFVVRGSTGNC